MERERDQNNDRPSSCSSSNSDVFFVKLNGLPWTATQKEICDFLIGCEVLEGPAGVKIEMNEWGKPSGSAFVQLRTKKDVENAMKCNKQMLGKRYVDIEMITNRNEKFFIKLSGLARKATTTDISDFISCGYKKQFEVVKRKNSGEAFVKIDNEEDLKIVLGLNDTAMRNRKINVTQVNLEEFDKANKQELDVSVDIKMIATKEEKEKIFIKLSGLARKATSTDIADFLSCGNKKQFEVVRIVNEKGKNSGEAFVRIDTEEDLKIVLGLNDTAMRNRKINVTQVNLEEFDKANKQDPDVFEVSSP